MPISDHSANLWPISPVNTVFPSFSSQLFPNWFSLRHRLRCSNVSLRLKLFLAMAFAIVAKQKSFPKAIQRIAGTKCVAVVVVVSIGVKFVWITQTATIQHRWLLLLFTVRSKLCLYERGLGPVSGRETAVSWPVCQLAS